jgi:hypothetical protein
MPRYTMDSICCMAACVPSVGFHVLFALSEALRGGFASYIWNVRLTSSSRNRNGHSHPHSCSNCVLLKFSIDHACPLAPSNQRHSCHSREYTPIPQHCDMSQSIFPLFDPALRAHTTVSIAQLAPIAIGRYHLLHPPPHAPAQLHHP